MRFRLLLSCFGLSLGVWSLAATYQYDDGSSESGLLLGGQFPLTYLTHYTISAGAETINSVELAWGTHSQNTLPNGLQAQVVLMSDPNQDGDPLDSLILRLVATSVASSGTDTFIRYDIAPVTFSPGTSFFVGAYIPDCPGVSFAAVDSQATGRSQDNWYMVGYAPGQGYPAYSPLIIYNNDWTFMNRANAVPEPASAVAVGCGLLALSRRKRGCGSGER